MGLDQYAGLRDSKGEVHEKFYWRKHARLQVFMARQFNKQKPKQEQNRLKMVIGIASLVMVSFGVNNSKRTQLKNTKPKMKSF